jgi:hypothetical protein
MRATLTTISAVALLAAGAGPAAARTDLPTARGDATLHAQAVHEQRLQRRLTTVARPDNPTARSGAALHAQAVREQRLQRRLTTAASAGEAAPAPIVRVIRAPVTDGGFDWADAGIGAGLAAALLLSAAGVSAVRRQPPMTTR